MRACPNLLVALLFLTPVWAWDPPAQLVKSLGMVDDALFADEETGDSFQSRWAPGEAPLAYRIRIRRQGLYRISRASLIAAGIPTAEIQGRNLAMVQQEGPVAVFSSTEGLFGPADFLLFYGEGRADLHSRENVYWLVPGRPALRMEARSARVLDGVGTRTERPFHVIFNPKTQFSSVTRHWDGDWDHWFIRTLLPNLDEAFTIPTPGPLGTASNEVRLAMRAVDRNSSPTYSPLRSLQVRQGAQMLATIGYRGNGNDWQATTLPEPSVQAGDTVISLRATQGSVSVRDLVLTYPRRLEASGDRFCFDGLAGASNYRVTHLPPGTWILRVTDSRRPLLLTGADFPSAGTIEFGDIATTQPTFFLQDAATVLDVPSLEAVGKPSFADPSSQRVDMVVIADTNRFPDINRLVERRRKGKMKVLVASPQAVYDAYGYGLRHPDAIRQFLGSLYHHGRGAPPRYVLLVGDAYLDPLDTFGHGHEDVLPTHMGGGSFNYTAHDQWFVSVVGDDMLADMAIGRFAVRDNPACAHMVDKIIAFEDAAATAAWRSRVHLCADKADTAGNFEARQEELRSQWYDHNGILASSAYYDRVTANQWRTATEDAFANGRSLVQYMGHGFVDHWSDVFFPGDIQALDNTAAYPVVAAFACSSGEFNSPSVESESMSENLTEQANGGVAGFAATSLAVEIASAQIAHGLSEAWFDMRRVRLGDCVLHGFQTLHAFNRGSPELQFYALTGDPSLQVNPVGTTGDSDNDDLPDLYEMHNGLEPYINDADLDADGDGISNLREFRQGTLPRDSDTDGDTLLDSWETAIGSNARAADSDADEMPDAWEFEHGLAVGTSDATLDADNDGLTNRDEYLLGSDPRLPDTDFDGLTDGAEQAAGSDPLRADTDGDGRPDGEEVLSLGTSPTRPDSDGDGLPDGFPTPASGDFDGDGLSNLAEAAAGTDPRAADSDRDGLSDGEETSTDPLVFDSDGDGVGDGAERAAGLRPDLRDSDNDGLFDGWELFHGLQPLTPDAATDPDGDGLLNIEEFVSGTDPRDEDSDDDGLADGPEVHTYNSLPLVADTDGDRLSDGDEVHVHGSNPVEADTDGDGLEDGDEVETHGSDPARSDTDGDLLPDDWEVQFQLDPRTDDAAADKDNDGLSNFGEFEKGTRPDRIDTDSDGLGDGDEVNLHGTNPTRRDSDSDQADDDDEIAAGTDPGLRDSDGDGMQDGYELQFGLDPLTPDADGDPDGDLLTNLDEHGHRTNPFAIDTDNDGLSDVEEIAGGTLPYRADHDFDGLSDGDEINLYLTNPRDRDSDDDGLRDGQEISLYRTDPLVRDSDGDLIEDRTEVLQGSQARVADATADPDGDGLDNLAESLAGTRANLPDTDGDTLTDGDEVNLYQSDPTKPDTDGDGLRDDAEVNTHNTSPLLTDTDGDRMGDAWELANQLDPRVDDALLDPDQDGLPNLQEFERGTRPQLADSDSDGLGDLIELLFGTDAAKPDTDDDGLSDEYERLHRLDPVRDDALDDPDGDRMTTLDELQAGTHPQLASSVFELQIEALAGGQFRVSWSSEPGQRYRLMATSDLEAVPFAVLASGVDATPPRNHMDLSTDRFEAFRVEID